MGSSFRFDQLVCPEGDLQLLHVMGPHQPYAQISITLTVGYVISLQLWRCRHAVVSFVFYRCSCWLYENYHWKKSISWLLVFFTIQLVIIYVSN